VGLGGLESRGSESRAPSLELRLVETSEKRTAPPRGGGSFKIPVVQSYFSFAKVSLIAEKLGSCLGSSFDSAY